MRGGIGEGGTVVGLVFLGMVGEPTSWSVSDSLEVAFLFSSGTMVIGCGEVDMVRIGEVVR